MAISTTPATLPNPYAVFRMHATNARDNTTAAIGTLSGIKPGPGDELPFPFPHLDGSLPVDPRALAQTQAQLAINELALAGSVTVVPSHVQHVLGHARADLLGGVAELNRPNRGFGKAIARFDGARNWIDIALNAFG